VDQNRAAIWMPTIDNLYCTFCLHLLHFNKQAAAASSLQASSVLPADRKANLTSNLMVRRNGLPFFFCPSAFSRMQHGYALLLDLQIFTCLPSFPIVL
jgi:hypothetical protein